jgi:integrase
MSLSSLRERLTLYLNFVYLSKKQDTGKPSQNQPKERRSKMGLYKRGKVLWMAFTYQGRQIRRSTETTDKHLAKRIYDKVLGEIAEGKWFEKLPGEDKTVAELLNRYLNEYATFHQSSGTAVGTRIITEELEQVFGTMLLKELTPQRIVSYKVTCREKGLAPATINHRLGILRHAFKLAIREWGWIKENPAAMVVREKVNNDRDRWLKEDEEERLLEACLQYDIRMTQRYAHHYPESLRDGVKV